MATFYSGRAIPGPNASFILLPGLLPSPYHTQTCVSGGPGRLEDLTEEVDVLPKGQAHLLQARQQPRLQCAEGHLRPQVSRTKGACVLWGLHPTAVSAGAGRASLHTPSLQVLMRPLLPQEQRGAVGCVRLQPVHSRGSLLPREVHAERHSGAVPHQVGALQWGRAHAKARRGE